MSEFSESLHLRTEDPAAAVELLRRARVRGYVLSPSEAASLGFVSSNKAAWVPITIAPDEPPGRAQFDRVIAANEGTLVFWDYAEDHGCNVSLYEGSRRVGRIRVSFESRLHSFDRDVFVDRGLIDAKGAARIEEWLRHAVPGTVVAEELGLLQYRWLSFDVVRKGRDAGKGYERAIELDARGRVVETVAPLALEDAATNRWDVLARGAIDKWIAAGSLELDEGAEAATLADALADLFAERPSAEVLEDFLVDRAEVAELYASGAELLKSARS